MPRRAKTPDFAIDIFQRRSRFSCSTDYGVALLFFSRGALLRALTVAEDRFADDFSVGFSHPARDDGKQPQRLIVECEGDSARHSRQYYDINVKPIVLTLLRK